MHIQKEQQYAIAILIGFALVAFAIYLSGIQVRSLPVFAFLNEGEVSVQRENKKERHIYGNPKAKTILVEFSDFQCPYCAQLHTTLKKIVDESNETIAWEYRHLPLAIHSQAEISAIASECVSQLSDENAFWTYGEILMKNQKVLSKTFLTDEAVNLGISDARFTSCLEDEAVKLKVAEDELAGIGFGGNGTPFTIVISEDGTQKPISGALPYENWKTLLQLYKP